MAQTPINRRLSLLHHWFPACDQLCQGHFSSTFRYAILKTRSEHSSAMTPSSFTRSRLLLLLLALPFITASQCVVLFSSGDSDKDDDKEDEEVLIVSSDGSFVDAPVEGMHYRSGTMVGVTGPRGEFSYEPDQPVQFAIGDIALGEPVVGKAVVGPLDLVPGADIDTPAVINIARLLQSLDARPGDDVITIPAGVLNAAVVDNPQLSAAIEFLDFGDEAAFANSASQLVAVLTADYPFTASLVDAETARAHLLQWIEQKNFDERFRKHESAAFDAVVID